MNKPYALLTAPDRPPQSDANKRVFTNLLRLENDVTRILDGHFLVHDNFPPMMFVLMHDALTDATCLPGLPTPYTGTETLNYLSANENEFWNIDTDNDNAAGWTREANASGIPRTFFEGLLTALRNDLNSEETRVASAMRPTGNAGPQLPPRGGTPAPQHHDDPFFSATRPELLALSAHPSADQIPRFPFSDCQLPPSVPRLPETARPLSAFLTGPKTAPTQRALVQLSYGEDNNSFILAAPQQMRSKENITASMFHSASQRMQNTVYKFLDLHRFHDNILSNYLDKYTMPSILSYDLAVRQMIHEQPPGTRFEPVYLELGQLHLESFSNFQTRQKLLALESSASQPAARRPRSRPAEHLLCLQNIICISADAPAHWNNFVSSLPQLCVWGMQPLPWGPLHTRSHLRSLRQSLPHAALLPGGPPGRGGLPWRH